MLRDGGNRSWAEKQVEQRFDALLLQGKTVAVSEGLTKAASSKRRKKISVNSAGTPSHAIMI